MNKYRKGLIITLAFFLTVFLIVFVRDLHQSDRLLKFDSLMVKEMPDYWKPSKEDIEKDEKRKITKTAEPDMLLNTSSHQISREQLGRQSWTLLHMMSGQMPDVIDA